MTPMTGSEVNTGPDVVVPIMAVAVVAVVLAALFRRSLLGVVDELADLWRTYGPVAARRVLDRRPGLAPTPWFCDRCSSSNTIGARRCYRCGARREDAEAAFPDADTPAGPSAGLTQRTRRHG